MAVLSAQTIVEGGLSATYSAAASGGDSFSNSGVEFLHVKNSSSSGAHTVTVAASNTNASNRQFGALTKSNVSVSVPGSSERFIGPFPRAAFGGSASITYSGVTNLTIAVVKVKKY